MLNILLTRVWDVGKKNMLLGSSKATFGRSITNILFQCYQDASKKLSKKNLFDDSNIWIHT